MYERLAAITQQTKVVCFARFVMDVPATADVRYGRLTAGAEFDRIPGSAAEIDKLIMEQVAANKKNTDLFAEWATLYSMTGRALPSSDGRIQHLVGVTGIDEYSVRSYFPLGPDAFVISSHGVFGPDVKKTMREDLEVARHMRPRVENELPDESGICLDGAFSTINTPWESIGFGVRLKEFSDVHFRIDTIKNGGSGETQGDLVRLLNQKKLFAREVGLAGLVDGLEILRQGKKVVNGWEGEELLLRYPRRHGNPSIHEFAFLAGPRKDDVFYPYVHIKFNTGVERKQDSAVPTLSDAEAIALWDWYLRSIRVRPTRILTLPQ